MAENRTERATPRRRREARKKGQIARSRELPPAFTLMAVLLFFSFFASTFMQELQLICHNLLRWSFRPNLSVFEIQSLFQTAIYSILRAAGPIMFIAVIASVVSNLAQGGLLISAESLSPKFENLSPIKNVKKIFSKNSLSELFKDLLRLIVLTYLSYGVIQDELPAISQMMTSDVRQVAGKLAEVVYRIGIRSGIFLLVLAIADYAFQYYLFEESLKMTKQEVKDELKETEGNPIIKGRIRRMQREMARRRAVADVPTADVVVTNPTHYAVALKYNKDEMAAPRVVAKGKDFLAQRIKEIARKHDVPIVENPPLAQSLYKSVEIGQEIPVSLYKAVAEILAYIYRARSVM